jgi:hypothetical protein
MITQQIISSLPWIVSVMTIVAVAASVLITVKTHVAEKKTKTAHDLIVSYLKDKDFKMMSFHRIRGAIDEKYTDDFLLSLPARFPNTLRRARLKDANGKYTQPGLARISIDDDTTESDIESADIELPVNILQRIRNMDSIDQIQRAIDEVLKSGR